MNPLHFLDKFVIIGIGVSVILSLLLFMSGVDTVSSLIVGLLGTILAIQIDQIAKLERSYKTQNANFDLLTKLEKTTPYDRLLREIINNIGVFIENNATPLFQQRVTLEMEHFRDFIKLLSSGTLVTGALDNDAIIDLIDQTSAEFTVISPSSTDIQWWYSPRGKKFWKANLVALEKGVQIHRIFLFENISEEIKLLMDEQFNAGIKVYWAYFQEIPVNLRNGFGVFDSSVGYRLLQATDGEVKGYEFTTDVAKVREMKEQLKKIKYLSKQYHSETENLQN